MITEDLCHANFGVGDTYPNRDYHPFTAPEDYRRLRAEAGDDVAAQRQAIQATAPALYFTCALQANGITIFPCTGSAHRGGLHIRCSCECHVRRYMQAANARAAVENLRDVPPWNGEEAGDDDV